MENFFAAAPVYGAFSDSCSPYSFQTFASGAGAAVSVAALPVADRIRQNGGKRQGREQEQKRGSLHHTVIGR